jgi:hypothetical protein
MGSPPKSIEEYAEEKVKEKAAKVNPVDQQTLDEESHNVNDSPEPTIEPSKTAPGKVDVVQDGKIIGSQG